MLISNPSEHKDLKNLILITGGARSGKSYFAEKLAASKSESVVYLATMQRYSNDVESVERIDMHRARRSPQWTTIEEPFNLAKTINALSGIENVCLIDCLSLWVSNVLLSAGDERDSLRAQEQILLVDNAAVLGAISQRAEIEFIVVTNEVGAGIVPDNILARSFRDALGTANQEFARAAQEVWLTCVGLPHRLKPPLSPYPPGVIP
ncbi:MAG: bifunctional adenosylcobinamide kinase/adenosylcobinamide-phosphate guanylyltransferase [Candidatus Obscuribacterales bacterium]|nr:bifunctional adenosylcobinamide kinase/adenosylcobinamide-phosphate guanylyltransferase [Candidatus Obscuribacterales bacterium]